ncbi:hypothetical protein PRZ48_006144 [Zasmidium cellare]|uniref:NAD(P)-binding protein n=1 Tax=Zasmidium cellare TaxID=395010 RepID=A0ABR0EPI2_ZASCE|nr:hypothetical protein PRZ48_006144 [Zasmidium cellare]
MPSSNEFDPARPVDFGVVAGKTAIITGGASGIGLGFATALATYGAQVFILDNNDTLGHEAETQNPSLEFIHTDVRSWDAQHAAFKQVLSESKEGRIDVVVTSAGVSSPNIKHIWLPQEGQSMPSEPKKPSTPAMDVNLMGTFYTTHLALSYFVRQEATTFRPQLLLISGLAAYFGQGFNPDFNGANFGVRGMFKSLRREVPEVFGGFQVNLLAPTFTSTPMIGELEEMLTWRGAKIASVGDVVDAGVRCICDEGVEGRAVAVGKAREGDPAGNPSSCRAPPAAAIAPAVKATAKFERPAGTVLDKDDLLEA